MSSQFHLRRQAEELEHQLRVLRDRLRGQLKSLLDILGEDSDLLGRPITVSGVVVWILPLILLERSQDTTAGVRGAARRRLIREARNTVRNLERALARERDELRRRSLRAQLREAKRRLRRILAGG